MLAVVRWGVRNACEPSCCDRFGRDFSSGLDRDAVGGTAAHACSGWASAIGLGSNTAPRPSLPDSLSSSIPTCAADVSAASPKSVRCRHSAAPADTTSTVIPSISRGIRILAIRSRTSSTRCFAELLG